MATYRVYTKRKLPEDPDLEKGFRKKTKRQQAIDKDEYMKAKYISNDECKLLDEVLDRHQTFDKGTQIFLY